MRSVIRQARIGVQIGIKPHIKIAMFCAGKSDELKNRLYNENRSTNYGAEEKNGVKARFETLEHMFFSLRNMALEKARSALVPEVYQAAAILIELIHHVIVTMACVVHFFHLCVI